MAAKISSANKAVSQPTARGGIEDIYVSSAEVVCDGGNGALGHPRVFLHIDRAVGAITCGYCSRHYILDSTGNH